MIKKICMIIIVLFAVSNIFAASTGLIVVLSSLSCTALSAVSTLTDNILADSSRHERLKNFVADNDLLLSTDIARGSGQTLDAVAEIAEVSDDKKNTFFAMMKKHYTVIYPDADVAPEYRARTILEIAALL